MVALIILCSLFALFFFTHRRQSPAILAAIAGLTIFNLTASDVANFTSSTLSAHVPFLTTDVSASLYCALLILLFPLIVYFRSDRSCSSKFQLLQSLAFAALITALLLPTVSAFTNLDSISVQINGFLQPALIYIIIVSVVLAYFDILFRKAQTES